MFATFGKFKKFPLLFSEHEKTSFIYDGRKNLGFLVKIKLLRLSQSPDVHYINKILRKMEQVEIIGHG